MKLSPKQAAALGFIVSGTKTMIDARQHGHDGRTLAALERRVFVQLYGGVLGCARRRTATHVRATEAGHDAWLVVARCERGEG
jgi:hypothetical protein